MTLGEIQKRLKAADPAPIDESPQYRRFVNWFGLVSLGLHLGLTYWIVHFYWQYLPIASQSLETAFPILRDRISFLGGVNTLSSAAFTATIAVPLALTPISVIAQSVGYWMTVIRHGDLKEAEPLSIGYLLQGWLILTLFAWIVFVSAPTGGGAADVGMAGIFFWPIFPFIGLSIAWIAQSWVFAVLVAIWKFSRKSWGISEP